jgi:DNA-binding LacI/PurR family transcriptional regulator
MTSPTSIDCLRVNTRSDTPLARQLTQQLLGLAQSPTALFTVADSLALSAISALKDAPLRIPEDMAVAGFNNIPAAGRPAYGFGAPPDLWRPWMS